MSRNIFEGWALKCNLCGKFIPISQFKNHVEKKHPRAKIIKRSKETKP